VSVWAVLVAAGRGERLGEDRPKAFVRLGELPLLAEPLRRLDESEWIDAVVMVVPAEWEEPAILLAEELGASKVSACVTGGETRTESVRVGVAEVPEDAAVILVHDAARPLLPDEVIGRVIGALGDGFDGAVPGLAVADTVKRAPDGVVAETLQRSELVTVQTPQAFVATVLRAAIVEGDGSDCASLVEAHGGRVKVVEGDERLLKVTTRADLERVAAGLVSDTGTVSDTSST
jgi:2-C-methyl-D-erythritol 4-phosphate cytidylyltransferase